MLHNVKSVSALLLCLSSLTLAPYQAMAAGDGHEHHDHAAMTKDDPHAGHMDHSNHGNMNAPDPHAGHMDHSQHQMPSMDPHAGHDMGAASDENDPHAAHRAMMKQKPKQAESTRVDLLDNVLVDQNGKKVKFVSDVIGDKIVVMDFVYTTCTTVCPVVSAVFAQVQDRLGDALGKEVLLISVSVDPIRDTPQRLKAYSATHKAKDGWVWLTGQKRKVDEVLDGVGAYSTNFENHPPMVLVGDGRSGDWTRFYGFPNPDRLMQQVDKLRAARGVAMGK
jgi:protein SCO1/2